MGLRAYLMVKVTDNMRPAEFQRALLELEEIHGVDFVDPVIGSHDLVIMVEAPVTVESIANKIRQRQWVASVEVLRVVRLIETCYSSKSNLLEALNHPVLQPAAVN
jgi:hypothetical protein